MPGTVSLGDIVAIVLPSRIAATLALVALLASAQVRADTASVFLGTKGGEGTEAWVAGVRWHPDRARFEALGMRFAGYLEMEYGRWRAQGPEPDAAERDTRQYSAVPVLRMGRASWGSWFAEVGIGPSWITPIFASGEKRFSTQFQFRDHVGVGRFLGGGRHVLGVRIEHFSNAGVASPNPGVNFVALNYTVRL